MTFLKSLWDRIPAPARLPALACLVLLVVFVGQSIQHSFRVSAMRRQVEKTTTQVEALQKQAADERRRADQAAGEAEQLRKEVVALQSKINESETRLADARGRSRTARERYYEKSSP